MPWGRFNAALLSDEQARTIKMNAITKWAALPAIEMFLNHDDSDFSAFMSIWFYEEQKHSLVLLGYLRRFRPDLVPTEEKLYAARFEFDPAPAPETLMLHLCGEIRLNQWYRRAADWHTESVIKHIYQLISQDEARHGGAYLRFAPRDRAVRPRVAARVRQDRCPDGSPNRASQAAASDQPPCQQETLSQRHGAKPLARPEWLECWLDEQVQFAAGWEKKVSGMILKNLSLLLR